MNTVFDEGAKKELLDLIKRHGELSVDDATRKLKLAKTTVRQHLLHLEKQGMIRRKSRSAGQGRPSLLFEIAEAGRKLFPSQESALLRELIDYLNASGQGTAVQDFFEKFWDKRRDQFLKILSTLGPRKNETEARLEALKALLEAEGFMPRFERVGNRISVRECNCPFAEAIRATQLPCKLESEFIRWALKLPLERTSYIHVGDASCTYSTRDK